MSDYPNPYTSYTEVETDQSGRHPVNVGHLVMGVAFSGAGRHLAAVRDDGDRRR
ncbi:hypothetical protein [Nocardioides sp. B-3]|uniref:hypothetical protein n=1 Tax=Nocardioides sp. B-3 TaxID=2895565 RepID=UPI002152D711|nr:hypothetical protein [Nocardioides sp. B-3]UUZ57975.1 hypothetical protein LP418_16745 [Nocardioides sp. B-3]